MADQIWRAKFWTNSNFLGKNWYIVVFRVADYKSSIKKTSKIKKKKFKKNKETKNDSQQSSTFPSWESDNIWYNGERPYKIESSTE